MRATPCSRPSGTGLAAPAAVDASAAGDVPSAGSRPAHRWKRGVLTLSTSNLYPTGGLAASPGSCLIIAGRSPEPPKVGDAKWACCRRRIRMECGYDRACGGDRRRRSDRADAGGRVGAGGRGRRDRRAARQPGPSRLARRWPALARRSRSSISAESPIGSSRRDRWPRSGSSPGSVWTSATFPPGIPTTLGLWQKHIERILAGWVDELAVPIYRGREVTGFAQDETGVDVELSDGRVAAGGVPRRLRRRTQPGPQGGRHRVPRGGIRRRAA